MRTAILAALFVVGASGAVDPAVARFGQAAQAYEKKEFATVVRLLSAPGQPASLRDYVAYYLANAQLVSNAGESAVKVLEAYGANPVASSPLAGRIFLLQAKALMGQNGVSPATIAKARNILQSNYALLPQPDGDFALAQAFEQTGFPKQAADYYGQVYYGKPASDLADKAKAALDKLKSELGAEFPSPTAKQKLTRAQGWLDARQYVRARQEYSVLANELSGGDRDLAKTGVGVAMFLGSDPRGAETYLKSFEPSNADAAAQRLYYLTEAFRRNGEDSDMLDVVGQLQERYPQSEWLPKALLTAGNRFLLTKDRAQYVPLYQRLADSFPNDGSAALSHWRVVWAAWLERNPRRVMLLKQQIERFPADGHVSDALYFLGREAEQSGHAGEARAYYTRLAVDFPHYYYAGLAREKLKDPKIASAKADADAVAWLDRSAARHTSSITSDLVGTPNEATRARIDRGRLLIEAGLATQAIEELQFGVKQNGEQATLLTMELAGSMPEPYLGLKVMKRYSGDYLSLPFDKAPRSFWEMLFPLPYRDELTADAKTHNLDPLAVAGLIRQESEFNPGAKSAFAYGLMQLRPSTGKEAGRHEGLRVANPRSLFSPALNIKVGTEYLKSQLDAQGGDWIKTLVAYNAGPTRVREWVGDYGYDDPAEFIENIPFTETRDYVQAVLRNQQAYRELYGPDRVAVAAEPAGAGSAPAAKIANSSAVAKLVSKPPAPRTAANVRSAKPAVHKATGSKSAVSKAKTTKHAAA